jgi:hypothetical protein
VRGTWAFLCPFELDGVIDLTNRTDFYMNLVSLERRKRMQYSTLTRVLLLQVPSFLFFSNYLILLFVWAELYHFHGMNINRLRVHLFVVLGVMYVAVIVLFVVDVAIYESVAVPVSGAVNIPEHIMILYLGEIITFCPIARVLR